MESFSHRLALAMKRRGLNQSDLARAVRTTQSSVFRWLNGTLPRLRILWEVSDALHVNREWLIEGQGVMEKALTSGNYSAESFPEGIRVTESMEELREASFSTGEAETAQLYQRLDTKALINVMHGSLSLLDQQDGIGSNLINNLKAGVEEIHRRSRLKDLSSQRPSKPKTQVKKS